MDGVFSDRLERELEVQLSPHVALHSTSSSDLLACYYWTDFTGFCISLLILRQREGCQGMQPIASGPSCLQGLAMVLDCSLAFMISGIGDSEQQA